MLNVKWLLTIIFCAGIFMFIYTQQMVLYKEADMVISTTTAPLMETPQIKKKDPAAKRGKVYKIDPDNDPLAPVVKKAQVKPSQTRSHASSGGSSSAGPSSSGSKTTYERPSDDPILVQ